MLRIQNWLVLVLTFGLIVMTTSSHAQDKAATEKAKEKSAPADSTKYDIKWTFEKDKPVYQEMSTKTSQLMKVMGMEVNQTQEQTFYFSWVLKDEDKDGNKTLVQKIEGVKLKIDIAGNPITFDSANPGTTNTSLAEFFKQLVNAEFTLILDKDLKVKEVKGREEFLKKLSQANQTMEPLLKRVLNDEALKQMVDPSFGVLPGKPVGTGDTWKRESKLSLGPIGSYKNSYEYKLEEVKDDVAKIGVTCTLAYDAPTEKGEGLPFSIKSAKLASKEGKGTVLFNVKKGRLDKQEMTIKLEGDLEIEISATATKVSLQQDQTTTITTSDQPQMKKS